MPLTPGRAYRFLAISFAVLAILSTIGALRARWAATVDFDVVGVFWLIRNVGPVALWAFAILFTVFALYCGVKAWATS
jgi:hypothetical protein